MTIDINKLRQLLAGATKLPWQLATSNSWRRIVGFLSDPVCTPTNQPDGHPDLHFRNGGAEGSDAQLLIAAVNALPELLNIIDAQSVQIERSKSLTKDLGKIIHNMVAGEQAAWIEWQHGKGAEAAMSWIHNGLAGPGHIPDEDAPYGKEPQAWYDANCADPFPACFCGRPSNSLWMGQGFCCDAHYREAKARVALSREQQRPNSPRLEKS